MKYLFILLILFLTSCSLDKNSNFWNTDLVKKSLKDNKLSTILKKNSNFKTMTFEEFNIFLKDYSNKAKYPDIDE